MKHYNRESGTFIGKGGLEIFFQCWKAAKPRGIVVIVHGLGEHSGRFTNIIHGLAGKNISVYAMDLRGHGKSRGKRGHVCSFMDYVADLNIYIEIIRGNYNKMPIIMLGHSMGGLIAITYAIIHKDDVSGLVLSAPLLKFAIEVPSWKKFFGRILSRIAPSFSMRTGLNPADLSHDSDVIDDYENDILVHDRASSRWFTEVEKAMEDCMESADELTLPLFIVHGKDDKIVDHSGSLLLYERAFSDKSELHVIDGFYHEPMNESGAERTKIIDIISTWILKTAAESVKAGKPEKKNL